MYWTPFVIFARGSIVPLKWMASCAKSLTDKIISNKWQSRSCRLLRKSCTTLLSQHCLNELSLQPRCLRRKDPMVCVLQNHWRLKALFLTNWEVCFPPLSCWSIQWGPKVRLTADSFQVIFQMNTNEAKPPHDMMLKFLSGKCDFRLEGFSLKFSPQSRLPKQITMFQMFLG